MRFILFFMIVVSTAVNATSYIEKSGNKCPPGYSDTSGKYCKTYSEQPKQVLTKTGGKCPPGWSNTKGNYCVNRSSSQDDVIIKSGKSCPSGYRNTQGGYCKRQHRAYITKGRKFLNCYSPNKSIHRCNTSVNTQHRLKSQRIFCQWKYLKA